MIRHFVDIDNFSKKILDKIIDNALKIKSNNTPYKAILQDKTLALLFNKQSLRTRMSFDVGMKKLGGNVIQLNSDEIGFGKRESEEDILKTISQYVDCLMIRNNDHKKINQYASLNILPIINGLSNMSHPCQILSDIFTLKEKFGKISNIKIFIIYSSYMSSSTKYVADVSTFSTKFNCIFHVRFYFWEF